MDIDRIIAEMDRAKRLDHLLNDELSHELLKRYISELTLSKVDYPDLPALGRFGTDLYLI